jgi:hypothetical protein
MSEAASGLADELRSAATSLLEDQKGRAAELVHGLAAALKGAARSFEHEQQKFCAHYTDEAAEQIERFSETMRGRSFKDLIAEVDAAARRQPQLFLLGAVAAGLVAGRVIASASGRPASPAAGYGAAAYGDQSAGYSPGLSPEGM